jgi:cytoskeletal protein CcmA (bactofilin family)
MSFAKGKEGREESTPSPLPFGNAVQPASTAGNGKVEAMLGRGTKVVGTLTFSGPAEVDGQVEGEIVASDRLTIGESAIVNGKVSGTEVIVKGTVNGDIIAQKRLSLRKPAKVLGNITSAVVSIEEGVVFEGKCTMVALQNQKDNDTVVVSRTTH